MTAGEQGFLLLTSFLGNPERKPLSIAQFRELTKKARLMDNPNMDRELTLADLQKIGCNRQIAERVLKLLSQKEQLQWYLQQGRKKDCFPVTRISAQYPQRLRSCLNMEAPGAIWAKGDRELLKAPGVALVGSRDLLDKNREFAREVGRQAARQGFVLISGDARGADRTAQDSCLEHGGAVVSIVADELEKHPLKKNVLYLSEDGFDLPFTAQRALKRNRVIHALAEKTFVAQCGFGKGGTWDGTCKNLQHGWNPVFCFNDGSKATLELECRGASLITCSDLRDFDSLQKNFASFMK